MMSSHGIRNPKSNDSKSFNANTYEYMLLNQRARSIVLSHHLEESQDAFGDYRSRTSFNTQRKEESKETAHEHRRKTVSFNIQFQPNKEESKEEVDNSEDNVFPCLPQRQPNASQLNYDIDQERINIYTQGRELYRDITGPLTDTSGSTFQRGHNRSRSQDRMDQDDQNIMSTYRKRIERHEIRKVGRQSQILAVEYGSELPIEIQPRNVKNKATSRSLDSGKRFTSEEKFQQNDNRLTKVGMVREKSREETDKDHEKLRGKSLYLTHSSKTFLARHYGDPIEAMPPSRKTPPSSYQSKSMRERYDGNALTPQQCYYRTAMSSDSELEVRKCPDNGWVVPSSKKFKELLQAPGDLLSLATNNPKVKEIGMKDTMIRRTNQVTNQLEESKKQIEHKVPSATKVKTKSTAFDPFPSSIGEHVSWNDATWPVSELSSKFLDTWKEPKVSSGEICSSSSGEGEAILSPIEMVEANNDSGDSNFNTKENSRFKLLVCANRRPKPFENNRTQKSLSTTDQSSTFSSSSLGDPVALTSEQNRIKSKSKGSKKKGSARGSFMSSFSKPKDANKEWLRTSIEDKSDGQRKRDKKMKEWLNIEHASGDDIVQGTSRGGTMETVFYDARHKQFEDQ